MKGNWECKLALSKGLAGDWPFLYDTIFWWKFLVWKAKMGLGSFNMASGASDGGKSIDWCLK